MENKDKRKELYTTLKISYIELNLMIDRLKEMQSKCSKFYIFINSF